MGDPKLKRYYQSRIIEDWFFWSSKLEISKKKTWFFLGSVHAIGLILIYHPLQTETSFCRGSKGLHTWFLLRFSKLQQKPMVRCTIYGSMAPCEPTRNCQKIAKDHFSVGAAKGFLLAKKKDSLIWAQEQWKETNSSWEDSSVTDAWRKDHYV